MQRISLLLFTLTCILGLAGCRGTGTPPSSGTPTQRDSGYTECWTGTITDMFSEGGNTDSTQVIALEVEDIGPMYFTIVEDTEYFRCDPDAGTAVEITKDDLSIGDAAEIQCRSYPDSGYHPILSVKVPGGTEDAGAGE